MQYLYYDFDKKYLIGYEVNHFCKGNKPHKFQYFERNGEKNKSDFEQICNNCGQIRIVLEGFNYDRASRINYLIRDDELGFIALLKKSSEIKSNLEAKVKHTEKSK